VQAGIVAATMANIHRPSDKPAMQPHDFMPVFDRDEAEKMKPAPEPEMDPRDFLNRIGHG